MGEGRVRAMAGATAIVLAAGQGKRMKSEVPKQFLELRGRPMLAHSLEVFQRSPLIQEIVLVTGQEDIPYCREKIVEAGGFTKVRAIVPGGQERYDSVYEGLRACGEACRWVFIHDGARPLVSEAILERAMAMVKERDACVVGMPVKDTIKIADADGSIQVTPDRSRVWMIQTPQVFRFQLVREAYSKLMTLPPEARKGVTDDAMVVEQMLGRKVYLTEGSYSNIKITTPEDLAIAEVLLGEGER